MTKLGATLEDIYERLRYAELIVRYDRPETLFYLDPSFWGCERDYGPGGI